MKTICATLFFLGFVSLPVLAQTAVSKAKSSTSVEQEIIELERQWAAVIKSQDIAQASRFLSEDYFLAVGVQGAPLYIFPRKEWLETLKFYVTESYNIDDTRYTYTVIRRWLSCSLRKRLNGEVKIAAHSS